MLFPKFCAVKQYLTNENQLRRFLTDHGVRVMDAAELHSKVSTYDGEHFCVESAQLIAESVQHWLSSGKPLADCFCHANVEEPMQRPAKVAKHTADGTASDESS